MRRTRRGAAVLTGALVSAATLCGGFAMQNDTPDPVADDMPLTLLVEGRLGVKVPAQWVVERITSGPGSARVQIVSSQHPDIALHITQSSIPRHHTWEMAAESLRQALNEQPLGVFVDFNPADRRVDRPAVTYQEMRADHHIQWVVLVDDALRIAIGCQSAPGREQLVRDACDQAVQSAHAVF
jgi:type VII secretion-associated protein (TIGR03931 family)